jgi:cytochrome c biogenesis protein CcmG/thiol:disulfide interchange protein DsbE
MHEVFHAGFNQREVAMLSSFAQMPAVGTACVRPAADSLLAPAPDFILDAAGGGRIRLSDFQGEPVVLIFFATWGAISRAQLKALVGLARSGVAVLGISRENSSTLACFAAECGVPFPLLSDLDGLVGDQYRVTCLPTTVGITPHGRVVTRVRGDSDLSSLADLLP